MLVPQRFSKSPHFIPDKSLAGRKNFCANSSVACCEKCRWHRPAASPGRVRRRRSEWNRILQRAIESSATGAACAANGANSARKSPASRRARQFEINLKRAPSARSFAELGDTMREPWNFSAGVVLVNRSTLRGAHDRRLGFLESRQRCVTVAACDRLLDPADRTAQGGAARLVDLGAACDLARGFAGGLGVCHVVLVYRRLQRKTRANLPDLQRKGGRREFRRHKRGL